MFGLEGGKRFELDNDSDVFLFDLERIKSDVEQVGFGQLVL